jgi:Uma2 family endonuclease
MAATVLMEDPAILAEMQPVPRDYEFYEVVNGERIGKPLMSAYAVKVGSDLLAELIVFTYGKGLGQVVSEMLFRLPLKEDASLKRRPDVAYVSFATWPADRPMLGRGDAWDVIPDLAVEVISPTNLAQEVMDKVQEYLQAGVRLVWVVYPMQRQVWVHESPTKIRVFAVDDTLDAGAVIPGFQLPLNRLFGPVALVGDNA